MSEERDVVLEAIKAFRKETKDRFDNLDREFRKVKTRLYGLEASDERMDRIDFVVEYAELKQRLKRIEDKLGIV